MTRSESGHWEVPLRTHGDAGNSSTELRVQNQLPAAPHRFASNVAVKR